MLHCLECCARAQWNSSFGRSCESFLENDGHIDVHACMYVRNSPAPASPRRNIKAETMQTRSTAFLALDLNPAKTSLRDRVCSNLLSFFAGSPAWRAWRSALWLSPDTSCDAMAKHDHRCILAPMCMFSAFCVGVAFSRLWPDMHVWCVGDAEHLQ
jgi:hypothetical protein